MDVEVVVHGIAGDVVAELLVSPTLNVRDLKRYLGEQLAISRFRQRLIVGETTLEDSVTLAGLPDPLAVTVVVAPFVDDPPARPLLAYIDAHDPDAVEEALCLPMNPDSVKVAYQYGLLHYAINVDSVAVVSLLCEAKADLTRRNYQGRTPLGVAAARGNIRVIRALCNGGANVDGPCDVCRDHEGAFPLEVALLAGKFEAAYELGAWGAAPMECASVVKVVKKHTQWYRSLLLLAVAMWLILCSCLLKMSASTFLPLANVIIGVSLLAVLILTKETSPDWALFYCAGTVYCTAGGVSAILRSAAGGSTPIVADILTVVVFAVVLLAMMSSLGYACMDLIGVLPGSRMLSWTERASSMVFSIILFAPSLILVCKPPWRAWVLEHSQNTALVLACVLSAWGLWHALPPCSVTTAIIRALLPFSAKRKRSVSDVKVLISMKYPDHEMPTSYGTF